MGFGPFIFDAEKGETPESVARQRAVAEALAMRGGTPHNIGEGIAAVGNALAYRKIMARASAGERAGQQSAADAYGPLAALLSGGAMPSTGSPAPTGAPGMGGGTDYQGAIANIESSGKYDLLGPVTKTGDRAYGKYQVMGANVGPWTQQVLGQSMTPDQFVADPKAQDAVFNTIFGGYVKETGSPEKAALKWFTGRSDDGALALKDQLGTSGQGYVNKFAGYGGGGGAPAPSSATTSTSGMQQALAMLNNPWASPAQKMVAQAIIDRAMPKAPESFTLSEGAVRYGPDGKIIATNAKPASGADAFTLTEGQTRFGPDGKPIATIPQGAPKATPDIQNYEYYKAQALAAGKTPLPIDEWDAGQRKASASVINNTVGGETLTPGWKKIDEGFADQWREWVAAGGYADVDKQIAQLDEAAAILKKNPGAVANPINAVGGIPFFGAGLQAWLNPDGTIAQDKVYEVVQRNLRAILGAQFTENEGTRLMARAFNPNLKAEENIARIEKLTTQIRSMAQAKQAAADWFDEKGTLRGFKGKIPSAADLDKIDFGDAPKSAPAPKTTTTGMVTPPALSSMANVPRAEIPPNGFDDAGAPPKSWTDGGGTPDAWRFLPPEQRELFQ